MHVDESARYLFEVAYRGTAYHGWQKQHNAHTVQEEIENACKLLWPDCGSIVGSGRTDTGVHCRQQFFHLDLPVLTDLSRVSFRLNSILPNDIAIGTVRRINTDAHARFSAVNRSYEYRISRKKDVFAERLSYYFRHNVNVNVMNKAAGVMKNFTDFKALSKVHTDVHHFNCEIRKAKWTDHGDELHFNVTANRFLRGMVRAMVGTLLMVGRSKITIQDMHEIMISGDRRNAGAAVPAHGLYLVSVEYPESIYKTEN